MNLKNIRIVKAEKKHVRQMAGLVSENLGTCNLVSGQEDILTRNISELTEALDCYQVAVDENDRVIGLCGIGNPKIGKDYGLDIGMHRDVLYVVIDKAYQKKGIGTALLQSCLKNSKDYPVLYEAWGEIKNGDVNSYKMLAKCSFKMLKDLGTSFYKDHGYCAYCVDKDKNCRACFCKIYIFTPVR
ncbi:MAG: GNAT family N-acetyltransferase [Alphaproteobacteria bacterium]|nr:GNAT family N-acetyltransferase [Alphaproteobacteria bacterium]